MSLDRRLTEIFPRLDYSNNRADTLTQSEAIEAIKQAFIDEGWVRLQIKPGATFSNTETYRGDGRRMMTGPEWLERFEKELRRHPFSSLPTVDPIEAARRASGVDHE